MFARRMRRVTGVARNRDTEGKETRTRSIIFIIYVAHRNVIVS